MIYLLSQTIDRSAEKFPDREAMRFNKTSLTYSELVRRASNLALVLMEQGVKKHDRVGIFLNKSLETPVAIYGIWKAGAAYVPLDPLAPVARLESVIRDCGIRHIVSHEPKLSAVKELVAANAGLECVVGIGEQDDLPVRCMTWDDVFKLSEHSIPDAGLMEHDLAYIMYTSGSTGKPKGMMHTHYSGLSYARMAAHTYGVHDQDRLSNHSPLHFDMSTFEYFSGPLSGATTVIIPEAYTKLPASMAKLIEEERLTIWYSVPFALTQLLWRDVLKGRDLSSLRWVMFGGEPFPPKDLHALMKLLPQSRFSNVYGPAEVNQCTYYHVPPIADDSDEAIPLGVIWDNAEGLIVDEHDCPVPVGETGELLVRTPTMMRGYWGRPDLNEKAFYRRKTFENYEDVFYRTGDLVALQPDGNMKFLGRKDRQIKTRGFRVELDEIELALSTHDLVEEGAVFAVPHDEGTQQIQAAVIVKSGASLTPADLKAYLAERIPWYAVPLKITQMQDFPRTSSGKIDRRALREQAVPVSASNGS